MTRSRLFLALLALGLASLFALAAVTERKTVTGTISDSMCGAAGHMMTDKGQSGRMAQSLTWRIGLSIGLIALVIVGILTGWIEPHGIAVGH